jgi:large subunit ribosomal protein LP2
MKHIAAYLLAVLGGNDAPAAKDITSILSSVGVDADADQLKSVLGELKGKNVEEVRDSLHHLLRAWLSLIWIP